MGVPLGRILGGGDAAPPPSPPVDTPLQASSQYPSLTLNFHIVTSESLPADLHRESTECTFALRNPIKALIITCWGPYIIHVWPSVADPGFVDWGSNIFFVGNCTSNTV